MWPRLANTLIGLWLLAAPDVLSYGGAQAANDRIFGPVVASIAVIAIWQVTRPLRRANLVFGGWLVVAPWLLGAAAEATLNSMLCGALIVTFALRAGPTPERLGGGWRSVLRSPAAEGMPR